MVLSDYVVTWIYDQQKYKTAMACISCKTEKLSSEFPSKNVSNDCEHPSLTCLRCLVQYVDEKEQCPHPGCSVKIPKQSKEILLFKAVLLHLFKEYESTYTPVADGSSGNQFINITGLTGESISVLFSPGMTVDQLKTTIEKQLKHKKEKQKLLYECKNVNVQRPNGEYATLSDYGIKANSTMCLIISLLDIPEDFDNVVFDLHWGFPSSGPDFLDASCLIFKGSQFETAVDFRKGNTASVQHSGDIMDPKLEIGHHTINVSLKKIPKDVTHLFFTLSAWSSPNIAQYPNPSLKFYDALNPKKDLCQTTFDHARNSEAVVMCSVSRNDTGHWQIFRSGQLSAGNAARYSPLIATIQQLIAKGI